MNTDFRLSTGIFENVKFLMLGERLGSDGQLCLIRLFRYVSVHKPEGSLNGMGPGAIEMAAGYHGNPGAFFEALSSLQWIDTDQNGVHSIHDWREHNPWAFGATARSHNARAAAEARWEAERNAKLADVACAEQCDPHAQSIATGNAVGNASGMHGAMPTAMPLSPPLPSLPFPPESTSPEGAQAPPEPPPKKQRATRLPEDWQPTEAMLEWAEKNHPTVDALKSTGYFVNFWIAKPGANGLKLNWPATWRNWIAKDADDGKNLKAGGNGSAPALIPSRFARPLTKHEEQVKAGQANIDAYLESRVSALKGQIYGE